MDEVYRQKFISDGGFPSPGTSNSKMSKPSSYTPDTLKKIGEQCSSRLPPAHLVQVMFMYEMQRQSEVEHLFRGQLFALAKAEEAAVEKDNRIEDLEKRLEALEKKFIARDVEERIATSNVRMNAQQEKLNAASGRLGWAEKRLDTLSQQLESLKAYQEEAAAITAVAMAEMKEVASPAAAAPSAPAVDESIAADLTTAKEEINVLFDDRDGILRMVGEVNERLTKLEENIRMLTLQRTPLVSPAAVQRIPVRTMSGDLVDLSIPKGNPAVGLNKENRPREIRSFCPGKQWAS